MTVEIFVLAVGSMFWPALLALDVVAFRSDRPVAILAGFLAGGLLTTVTIGCLIVFALEHTSLVTRSRHTTDPAVSIAVGAASLVLAFVIRRGDTHDRAQRPSRVDRLADHGAALAFVTGIVLNVFPGLLPFVAMKDIGELNATTAGTVAVIVAFYVVMFTPVEAPLVAFLVAPQRTARSVNAFNVWLGEHWRRLAWWALLVFGAFEVVRGVVSAY